MAESVGKAGSGHGKGLHLEFLNGGLSLRRREDTRPTFRVERVLRRRFARFGGEMGNEWVKLAEWISSR
jgi:hypothetical protein